MSSHAFALTAAAPNEANFAGAAATMPSRSIDEYRREERKSLAPATALNAFVQHPSPLQSSLTAMPGSQLDYSQQQLMGNAAEAPRPWTAPAASSSILAPSDDPLTDILMEHRNKLLETNDGIMWTNPFQTPPSTTGSVIAPAAVDPLWSFSTQASRRGSSIMSTPMSSLASSESTFTTPPTSLPGSQRTSFSLSDDASLKEASSFASSLSIDSAYTPCSTTQYQAYEAPIAFKNVLQRLSPTTWRSNSHQPDVVPPPKTSSGSCLAQRPITSLGLPTSSALASSSPANRHVHFGPITTMLPSAVVSALPLFGQGEATLLSPSSYTPTSNNNNDKMPEGLRKQARPASQEKTVDLPMLSLGRVPLPPRSFEEEDQELTSPQQSPDALSTASPTKPPSLPGVVLSKDSIPPPRSYAPLYGSPGKAVGADQVWPAPPTAKAKENDDEAPDEEAKAKLQRKNRSTIACNPCRKSKRKCDGNWPCASCQRRKDPACDHCVYETRAQRPTKRTGKVAAAVKKGHRSSKSAAVKASRIVSALEEARPATSLGLPGTSKAAATVPSQPALPAGLAAQDSTLESQLNYHLFQPSASALSDAANQGRPSTSASSLAPVGLAPGPPFLSSSFYGRPTEVPDLFGTASTSANGTSSALPMVETPTRSIAAGGETTACPPLTPMPPATPCFASSTIDYSIFGASGLKSSEGSQPQQQQQASITQTSSPLALHSSLLSAAFYPQPGDFTRAGH